MAVASNRALRRVEAICEFCEWSALQSYDNEADRVAIERFMEQCHFEHVDRVHPGDMEKLNQQNAEPPPTEDQKRNFYRTHLRVRLHESGVPASLHDGLTEY